MIAHPDNEDPHFVYKERGQFYEYRKKPKRERGLWHLFAFLFLFGCVFFLLLVGVVVLFWDFIKPL